MLVAATFLAAIPRPLVADKVANQYRHALAIYERGDQEAATREFEKILQHKPEHGPTRFFLGLIHARRGEALLGKGDQAGAESEFREALRLRPDQAYWHKALAELLKKQGDLRGAQFECTEAAALSPDDGALARGCGLEGQPADKPPAPNPADHAGGGSNAYKAAGDVTPPRPTYKPDPPYTNEPREARLQGILVVLIVLDGQGSVSDAAVTKSLGLGLDQNALRTVRT